MSTRYKLIDYAAKALIDSLITEYQADYEWALLTVLSSDTYQKLLEDSYLLEEGDLFLWEVLQEELKRKKVL